MTEKELSQYRSLKREITSQEKRIDSLRDKDIPVVAGKVSASMKDFPYTEIRVGVQMEDPKESKVLRELIAKKEKRIVEIKKLVLDIEDFISNIDDSELRTIFEARFIDGKKLVEIAKELNMDRSNVGKKIRKYLNFPPIPQKSII